MIYNHTYKITSKIKLHTKPTRELVLDRVGNFLKETQKYYIFDKFVVNKSTVLNIIEVRV